MEHVCGTTHYVIYSSVDLLLFLLLLSHPFHFFMLVPLDALRHYNAETVWLMDQHTADIIDIGGSTVTGGA